MNIHPIERTEQPSVEELRRNFLAQHKPVIVEGVADDWVRRDLCSPEALRAAFGDLLVSVRGSDDEFEVFFSDVPNQTMRLGDYIDLICSEQSDVERPPYFGNVSLNGAAVQELKERLVTHRAFPNYFENQTGAEMRIWVGAAGQRSLIHNDNYHNLNVQAFGRKAFLLFAPEQYPFLYTRYFSKSCWISPVEPQEPDFERFPLFQDVEGYEGVLEKGEMLFIPKFWWHQARALTTCINVNSWTYTGISDYWQQASATP
jgi:lysine-specific demethylase 8